MKILDIPRSGSIAGTTSSHNRSGQYVRNRRTPTNNPTPRRTLIRAAFGSASSSWSTLTAAEQNAWIAAADAHPVTDSLGQSIKLTGPNLYISLTTQLANCGEPANALPPSDFSVYTVSGTTGAFSIATGIALVLPGNGGANDFALIAFSKPVPAGRTFNATFSQNVVTDGSEGDVAVTTAAYAALFGTPLLGQKVFVKVTPVSQYGVTGVPVIFAMVVAA